MPDSVRSETPIYSWNVMGLLHETIVKILCGIMIEIETHTITKEPKCVRMTPD